jgi:SspJ family small acid-soluble spore protein
MADPVWEDTTPVMPSGAAPQQPQQAQQSPQDPDSTPTWENTVDLQGTYGTPGQTLLGAGEAASRGVIGRAATAGIERAGSSLGIPSLSPQDQAGREAASPVLSPTVEGGAFVGSALADFGLPAAIGHIGQGAEALSGLSEAAGLLPKLAASGIKTGAEFASLAADNELARTVNQDPGQTLGTAALNIGLAGIMGGVGGVALGSVAPLWKSVTNKIGVEKFASDFMGESEFLKNNPDPVSGAASEINDRIASADQLMYGGLKKDLIQKLTSEIPQENIQQHISYISDAIDNAPSALKNDPLFQEAVSKWKNAAGIPETAAEDFVNPSVETEHVQDALPNLRKPTLGRDESGRFVALNLGRTLDNIGPDVTKIIGEQPSLFGEGALNGTPTYDPSNVFKATENLKRQLQEWGQYNKDIVPLSERPFRNGSQELAATLKDSLENSKVWGAAGTAQKDFNAAIAPLFDIKKEFLGKFASKEMGDKVADSTKINTYLNQADKSKAGLKTNYVKNYLDQTQKAADTINRSYIENGLEQPLEEKLNPTPILSHSLETAPTAGVSLARWVKRGGAAATAGNMAGHIAGETVGGGLGFLVGHPLVGAYMGDKILKPIFSMLAKPLAQTAIDSEGAKASVDYLGNVLKGQKLLSNATTNIFKAGAEIIPKELIPNAQSRERTQKSLDQASANPQSMLNVGGSMGHYLPAHASAAAQTAAAAQNYFAQMKPTQPQLSPLDKPLPIDVSKEAAYNRQLDIATQPLMAVKYAKEGTLQAQDLQTIQTVYPGLLPKIASESYNSMVKAVSEGQEIPYKQRVSMSLLTGQKIDSTQSQPMMASILMANAPKYPPPAQIGKQKKVSSSTASTMEKSTALLQTPSQARQSGRLTS